VEELLAVNGSIPASPVVVSFNDFASPTGLALDSSGDVYVADEGSNTVMEILAINGSVSASSTIRTVAGFAGASGPTGVAVDGSGNVYVADPGNNTIYEMLAVNGTIPASPTVATLASGLNGPTGLTVDGRGDVYVADAGNQRIAKLSLSIGNFGAVNIGTTSPAIPMNFTFDTAGTLGSTAVLTQGATGLDFADAGTGTCKANTAYAAGQICTINVTFTPKFAGSRSGAAVLYNTSGNAIANGNVVGSGVGPQIAFQPGTLSTLSYSINNPEGLAVDGSGNLYVTDYTSNSVKEILAVNGSIPPSPTIRTLATGFNQPTGVALDSSGNLYVADSGNNAVKEILAVNGGMPASPTVVTLGSGFKTPYGVGVDRAGNVFVADSGNSAVKEIVAVNGSIPASPTILTLETNAPVINLAFDGSGNLYLTCFNSPVVELLAVNGSIPPSPTMRLFGNTLGSPIGLAVDSSGNVYVTNNQNSVSEIHAVNGSIPDSPTITTLGNSFHYPTGLALDSGGNLYIADSGNYRIVKLDFADAPSLTFAATNVGSTSADSPQTVTISNVGNAPLIFPIPSQGNNPSVGANFSLSSSSDCPLLSPSSYQPAILPAGASCELPISFTPSASGSLIGSLVLTDNNLNAAAPGYTTQSIKLSGTGAQPPPTFTLMAPSNMTVIQGASSTYTIQVIPGTGFTGSVNLAMNGLPTFVTASFTPNPTTGDSVLTLTASKTALRGTVVVVIDGIDGTQSAIAAMTVTVVAPPPSFSLGINPSSLTVYQGGSGTSTISVVGQNGFIGSVNLAASGLPSDVTASFNPNPTTGTSVLTFTASNSAVPGIYSVAITGTSGTLTGTNGIYLTIAPPPGFAPSSANLGTVNIATASTVQTLTYNFGADVTLGSTAVLTQGAIGLDFTDAGTGTCAANTAYTVRQSCTVNVNFTPKFPGTRYGAAVLNDNNGNPIATAYLQGMGVGPQINFLPGTESVVASATDNLYPVYEMAVDGNGSIYIAGGTSNVIWKETPSAGGYTKSALQTSSLNFPFGVALDGAGSIYIADSDNSRVLKETPSSTGYTETTVFDTANSNIQFPSHLAVDGSGDVFFFAFDSAYQQHLYKETPSATGYLQSEIPFSNVPYPFGVAVDGSGNIYIVDLGTGMNNGTGQLVRESPSGSGYIESIVPIAGLTQPQSIAVDGMGSVYVASWNNPLFKLTSTPEGYVQRTVSSRIFEAPMGIALDASGTIYVADDDTSQVFKEDLADAPSLGFASTVMGSTSNDSPQTVTVENVGNAPLSFITPAIGNNPSISANFSFGSGAAWACPLVNSGSSTPGTLAPGASCQLPISFTPATAGALSGSLVLTDNNLNATAPGYATQGILLSGTATQATPAITWATPAAITYGTALSGTQLNASSTASGTFTYAPAAGTVLTAGQQTLTATFTPTDTTDYTTASVSVTLTVNKATPTITWRTPASIMYGTALSATQLNATSTVVGSFAYSPAAGTVLTAGQQTLTATFTPTDTTDYTTASVSVTLTVNKATPAISWATPAPITYGTALSVTQLNARSTVAGSFTYSPAAGTVLNAGTQTLTATFTPTDGADYTTAQASVNLTVNKAILTISWAAPAAISYGTALSGTQLNASSTAAGTFVYSPAAGTVLPVGSNTLNVTFTPAKPANYTTSTATAHVTLTVNKATPVITWATPAPITYGMALSATQLDANSPVAGKVAYSPAAGKVLTAGQQTLTVTFTPTNSTDYTTATATVTLTVNKATPAITWATPAAITFGTALSATQLNAKASVSGALVYSPAAGTVPAVGTDTLTVTFTPTDTTDYTTASKSVSVNVL